MNSSLTPVFPLSMLEPEETREEGSVRDRSPLPSKADSPIFVTPPGMLICVRASQSMNALEPICVTVLGMVTDLS